MDVELETDLFLSREERDKAHTMEKKIIEELQCVFL